MGPMHRTVCLFTLELSLVLIVLTHREMARLSSPDWLVVNRDSLPISQPIQMPANQICRSRLTNAIKLS